MFHGNVDTRFKDLDENGIYGDPSFYNEALGGAKGFQLLASSPAINSGIAFSGNYSHPSIPVSDSEIFKNVESIPTTDFFGRSLTVNSTPNIGANNAKNGEITTYNNDTPRLKDLFIKDKIEFNNIKYNYHYVVYDIIGREMMRGALNNGNDQIALN